MDIEVCGEDMELLSPPAETSQEAAAAATHHSGAAEHAPGTGEAGWMWFVTPIWSLGTAACAAALTAGRSNTAPSTACLACTACLWWDARAGLLIRQCLGPSLMLLMQAVGSSCTPAPAAVLGKTRSLTGC